MYRKGASAINCNSICGPIFGGSHDILIASNSNANQKSFSAFGRSFNHTDYQYGSAKAQTMLAGYFYCSMN